MSQFTELTEKWLCAVKSTVKNNTYESYYCNSVRKHINPYFEKFDVNEIKQYDIQQFLNLQSERYCVDTVKKDKSCLFQFFEFLIINGNYKFANPVKNIRIRAKEIKEINENIYTEKELNLIHQYAYKHRFGYEVQILIETGISRSELLGLPWEKVDVVNKTITIMQGATEVRHGQNSTRVEIGTTKNHFRKRTIPISDGLAFILTNIKYKDAKQSDYVVHNCMGNVCVPTNWYRRHYLVFMQDMQDFYKLQGIYIPILTPHRIRHSRASIWVNQGKNIYAIAKILGHSDLDMLRKVYAHSDVEQLRFLLDI